MDKDKLNEAAWDYHSDNYFANNPHREDIMDAFKDSAEWLMSQPLSDRLTDEEKERIKGMWHDLMELYLNSKSSKLSDFVSMFKELFGVELTDDVIKAYQENLDYELHPSTIEIWRDIPEYEDLYQVSNLGRIKHKAT